MFPRCTLLNTNSLAIKTFYTTLQLNAIAKCFTKFSKLHCIIKHITFVTVTPYCTYEMYHTSKRQLYLYNHLSKYVLSLYLSLIYILQSDIEPECLSNTLNDPTTQYMIKNSSTMENLIHHWNHQNHQNNQICKKKFLIHH